MRFRITYLLLITAVLALVMWATRLSIAVPFVIGLYLLLLFFLKCLPKVEEDGRFSLINTLLVASVVISLVAIASHYRDQFWAGR